MKVAKQYGRYWRYDNQNWIEKCGENFARLDNFSDALIFPSGMSITTTLLALLAKVTMLLLTGKHTEMLEIFVHLLYLNTV